MRRLTAAVGSTVFFVVGPGVFAGLIPWLLAGWRVQKPIPYLATARVLGAVLLAAGLIVMVQAFTRFVVEGRGTPVPMAAPDRLVVGGLYRHVRNPMYVAGVAIIVGQALVLGQTILLVYAVAVWLVVASFVHWYEEPALSRRFGAQYEAYRCAVPAWWPACARGVPASPADRTHDDTRKAGNQSGSGAVQAPLHLR